MDQGPFAITGASGELGRRVVGRMMAKTAAMRLLTRDTSKLPEAPPGIQIVETPGGYASYEDMKRGFERMKTALLISASETEGRVALHETAIRAAVDAGVRRIVYTSFSNARPDSTFTFARDHYETEQLLHKSGVDVAIVRCNLFMDVLPYWAGSDGVIRGPAGDGKFAPVGREQAATAIAAVLLNEERNDTYELTGPQALTMEAVAATISKVSRQDITFQDQTVEEARESRSDLGAPDWKVEGWISTYQAIAAGELAEVSPMFRNLTGRPHPRFEDYLFENPYVWFHLVPDGQIF